MNRNKKVNPFLRTFIFLSSVVVIMIAVAYGLFYYVFSIPEPEGLSLASWPDTFTDNFSFWMEYEDGIIQVKQIGLDRLDEYGLWLQVIDNSGQEIFSHNKPESFPVSYTIPELVTLSTDPYENGNTVFVSSFEASGKTWNYIIGFPYAIGKYMLYYNGENVGRLSPMFRVAILIALVIVSVSVVVYCFWLTRHLSKIAKGIEDISFRNYHPMKERGVFSGIYMALNQMDTEVRHSDTVQADTDRARQEWIANITHDLKTPLSPVKGYAELLADTPTPDSQTVQEYGAIILKNVNHAEKLMNDLKLTYQLDAGSIPYHPQEVRLIRYLKEIVIDIINDPAFADRNIEFNSELSELVVSLDPELFRRAVQNLIINALVHNSPETNVTIAIAMAPTSGVNIFIRDNGTGMSETEQAELFNRYYRGTSTKERLEGSGLGLAIAKQIIMLHDGNITVKSSPGTGTEFTILIPV